MRTRKTRYTHVPRPILWLIRGGEREGVEIASFYLSKFPVTNVQLEAFVPGRERPALSPGDDDPATGVEASLAFDYCAWYAEISRKPMRLPTREEWEHACRGGADHDEPWFEDRQLEVAWCRENTPPEGPIPRLDHRAANPAGLWGMLGGVWEWVADGEAAKPPRTLCGGSIRTPGSELGPGLRRTWAEAPTPEPLHEIGFRIAKSLR